MKRAVFGYCRGLHYSKEQNIFSYLTWSAQGMARTVFSVSVNKYLLPPYFLSSTCCLSKYTLSHVSCAFLLLYSRMATLEQVTLLNVRVFSASRVDGDY